MSEQTDLASPDPSRPGDSPGLDADDRSHLELLRIFHYVMAGMAALGCLGLGAYAVLIPIIFRRISRDIVDTGESMPEWRQFEELVPLFIGLVVVVALAQLVFGVLSFLCGRYLHQRRNRMFCIVVAALTLLSFPLGTALGIFSLVVLSRPAVRDAFD